MVSLPEQGRERERPSCPSGGTMRDQSSPGLLLARRPVAPPEGKLASWSAGNLCCRNRGGGGSCASRTGNDPAVRRCEALEHEAGLAVREPQRVVSADV